MSEPFSGRGDVARPLRDMLMLASMILLGLLMRVVDVIVLMRHPRLLAPYFGILRAAWTQSPFREGAFERTHLARRAKQSLGELVYGETPITTARSIFRATELSSESTLIDLGAGRGRVLLAARTFGATAIGVELLPDHIDAVRAPVEAAGASMVQGDIATVSLDGATHLFLTWTCLSVSTRDRVLVNLRNAAPGTKVITVTFPVDDPHFETILHRRPWFSWGRADVYVARRLPFAAGATGS